MGSVSIATDIGPMPMATPVGLEYAIVVMTCVIT
jgi:hypothetical protein